MTPYKIALIKDYDGDLKKRWYVYYYSMNPDTGKMQELREWISSRIKTRTDRYIKAKELRDSINARLVTGWNPFSNNSRQKFLIEALEHIILFKSKSCGKRANHTYRNIANKFIQWLRKEKLAHLRTNEFNKYLAQKYFDSLVMEAGLCNRSHNNHLSTLRTLFNNLVERDYIDYNVLDKMKKLSEAEAEINTFTKAEMTLISNSLITQHPTLLLAAYFIYYCFIRPAELVRLKFKDINVEKGIVRLSSKRTKNKKNRPVIMPDLLVDFYIKLGYHTQPEELFIFACGHRLLPDSKEIAPTRISEIWQKRVQQNLKIKKGIYLLKHTGNGDLMENGADTRNIQLQNRHASLDETQVYLEKFRNVPSEKLREYFLPFGTNS